MCPPVKGAVLYATLDSSSPHIDLVQLDRDHPGFRDPVYRARRNRIARIALEHRLGDPVPDIEYTNEERVVWGTALSNLAPLHERYACGPYLTASARLPWEKDRVPQLREVNQTLQATTGFTMSPVAGLVSPRAFMTHLGQRVFLSTQYMRHHSAPLYTPEPDVIHELVGHAALLTDPDFAALNRLFGEVTVSANEETCLGLIRVYWYTLEFGVVRDGDRLKVVGAGLLSSFGELGRFEKEAQLRPLDLDEVARTPFDPTNYQGLLFVAPSLERLFRDLRGWLESR